jgi:hypothetical protein
MIEIPPNNPAKFEVSFVDGDGAPFDPTTGIKIKIQSPDPAVQLTLIYPDDLARDSVGVYHVVHEVDIEGDWIAYGQGSLPDGTLITTEDVVQKVGRTNIKF